MDFHWRRSALNSAGAFPENFGEFSPIHILYYKIPGEGRKAGVHVPPRNPLEGRPCIYIYLLVHLEWNFCMEIIRKYNQKNISVVIHPNNFPFASFEFIKYGLR